MSGTDALLIGQYLSVLIGQFASERYLIGMPDPDAAGVFQAEHAENFPTHPDRCVKDRRDASWLEE